ncbi:MAG: FkbM family methyltransferase [Bryobacteraceae bacterium]
MNFSAISPKTLVGKAIRLPLRLIPANARVRVIQGPLRGSRWIAGASIHGCWLGSYEWEKQRKFCEVVRRGDVVYDLGANVGFYTLLASVLAGADGKVYSFEPSPRNLRLLRTHLELNHVDNVSVVDVAVSSSDGCAQFDLGPDPSMGHLRQGQSNAIGVRTAALDTLVFSSQILPPSVIKCDIEGGEYEALMGARRMIVQYHPTILLATHGDEVHARCCRLLTELRYELTPLDRRPLEEAREILATDRRFQDAISTRADQASGGA